MDRVQGASGERDGERVGDRRETLDYRKKKKMGAGGDERGGSVSLDKEAGRFSDTRAREVLEIFKTRRGKLREQIT